MLNLDEPVKKGSFNGIIYSSAKKYACKKGELILTSKNFSINCEGSWSRTIPIEEVDLEAQNGKLQMRFGFYGNPSLRLAVDDAEDWVECFKEVRLQWLQREMKMYDFMETERPKELERLLDIKPGELKKLYDDVLKESRPFETKSIRFILDIYVMSGRIRNRKLRAFIVAHCYVAFYERTKRLLSRIYKARIGNGPENDEKLMEFLKGYPSWRFLMDTSTWGINPNQVRNCVSHGKFYFDYKNAVLVFMVEKEKRIPLRELWRIIIPMSHLYSSVTRRLAEKVGRSENSSIP